MNGIKSLFLLMLIPFYLLATTNYLIDPKRDKAIIDIGNIDQSQI